MVSAVVSLGVSEPLHEMGSFGWSEPLRFCWLILTCFYSSYLLVLS